MTRLRFQSVSNAGVESFFLLCPCDLTRTLPYCGCGWQHAGSGCCFKPALPLARHWDVHYSHESFEAQPKPITQSCGRPVSYILQAASSHFIPPLGRGLEEGPLRAPPPTSRSGVSCSCTCPFSRVAAKRGSPPGSVTVRNCWAATLSNSSTVTEDHSMRTPSGFSSELRYTIRQDDAIKLLRLAHDYGARL